MNKVKLEKTVFFLVRPETYWRVLLMCVFHIYTILYVYGVDSYLPLISLNDSSEILIRQLLFIFISLNQNVQVRIA